MTTIEAALVGAAGLAASRIVDSEDILECDVSINIKHSQGIRNVKVHMVALADGKYSVESIADIEDVYRGEVTL